MDDPSTAQPSVQAQPEASPAHPGALVWLMPSFHAHIEPGQRVRHPQQPDWGIGQVQSAIEDRITVNFPNAGKVVINARAVSLEVVEGAARD